MRNLKIFLPLLLISIFSLCPFLPKEPLQEPTPPGVTETSPPTAEPVTPTPVLETPTLTSPENLPSPTPTATPESQALNPEGPYILYGGKNGVWISNPDGSFLTQIFMDAFYNDFRAAVSPDGSRMALVTRDEEGYHLTIIELPSGQQTYVAQLLDGFGGTTGPPGPREFIGQVLGRGMIYNTLAWQPEGGRLLAFVGAINGDTTDLYVYNIQSQETNQLTDDPSYAILPMWSPDGAYILHYGVGWEEPFGGALDGHNRLYGVWTINPDDGQLISMPKPLDILPDFVGWQDEQHYLSCDDYHLKSVDIITGLATELMPCPRFQNEISLSTTGALLLSFRSDYSESFSEGIFYLASPFDTPRKVYDIPAWELSWIPESKVFFAYPEVLIYGDGLLTFQQPSYNNSYVPAVSTNGIQAWMVYDEDRQPAVKVYVPGDDDWRTILHESVEVLIWDPQDPGRLLIILGDGRLMTAQFPNFVPEVVGNFHGSASEAIYVP